MIYRLIYKCQPEPPPNSGLLYRCGLSPPAIANTFVVCSAFFVNMQQVNKKKRPPQSPLIIFEMFDTKITNMDNIKKNVGKVLLKPEEFIKKQFEECGHWKDKAMENTKNPKMFIYYCRMWNKALFNFKQRFDVVFPE